MNFIEKILEAEKSSYIDGEYFVNEYFGLPTKHRTRIRNAAVEMSSEGIFPKIYEITEDFEENRIKIVYNVIISVMSLVDRSE